MSDFWIGFTKRAAEKTKAVYRKVNIHTLDPDLPGQAWSVKIDGAHSIVDMKKGKLPRIFSHRVSKRTGSLIEYTPKLPHIQEKSPFNAQVRAETYATDKNGVAVHPDVVTAMLNSGVDKSLELQKKLGITTQTALIDVDKFEGKDYSKAPFKDKYEVMKKIVTANPDFHLPDIAHTYDEKVKLLKDMVAKAHLQSKEGLVIHELHTPGTPFAKAKLIDEHDVVVTGVFPEEKTKPGRTPMAGGFTYAWEDGGKPVGKIGTGFDHATKVDMLKNPESYIGRIARVKALDLSKNKVLVKPSFSMWHVEKNL